MFKTDGYVGKQREREREANCVFNFSIPTTEN